MFATNAQVAAALEVATAAMFDTRTDRERLLAGFKTWKKERKALARIAFTCCSTCGHYELNEKAKGRPYAFSNKQDAFADGEAYLEPFHTWRTGSDGETEWFWKDATLYLKHSGSSEDIAALVRCLQVEGLEVIWSGDAEETVYVKSAYRWEGGDDRRARKIAGSK